MSARVDPPAAVVPTPEPVTGRHIAYWRRSAARRAGHVAPLEPLSTWQAVGLIVVAVLIASLVVMSVVWWVGAARR